MEKSLNARKLGFRGRNSLPFYFPHLVNDRYPWFNIGLCVNLPRQDELKPANHSWKCKLFMFLRTWPRPRHITFCFARVWHRLNEFCPRQRNRHAPPGRLWPESVGRLSQVSVFTARAVNLCDGYRVVQPVQIHLIKL